MLTGFDSSISPLALAMLSYRSRRRLRDQTKDEVRLDSGTTYPCTRRQLESVTHPRGFDVSSDDHHSQRQHLEPYNQYQEGGINLHEVFEDDDAFRPIFEDEYGPPSYHGHRYQLHPFFDDRYDRPPYGGEHYDLAASFKYGYGPLAYSGVSPNFESNHDHMHRHQGRQRGRQSAMDAARGISHDLRKPLTEKESRAAARLRTLDDLTDWGPDVVMKAFVDLSTLFFACRLQNRVYVQWKSRREMASTGDPGMERSFGYTTVKMMGRGRVIQICLNKDAIFMQETFQPWKKMWGTLLHEMCVCATFPSIPMGVTAWLTCIEAWVSRN